MSRALVVGGGIIGTAIAAELSADGFEVRLLTDQGVGGGATAAGMGHLVALDGTEAKVALTQRSLELWQDMHLPEDCEMHRCGTLWVAETDDEMQAAESMKERFAARGVAGELVAGQHIAELEPNLRNGLAGGLVVPSDAVIYPPNAASFFWRQAESRGAEKKEARVEAVQPHRVRFPDGSHLEADWIVVAAGDRTSDLLPELAIRPRKGHLLITARGPRFLRREVVELGYGNTTESRDSVSVACNVQPRSTGQVLIGSSRQEQTNDPRVELPILDRMLRRALDFLPRLSELTALRAWTGIRAATEDGVPIIGVLQPGLAVASGHEGLGITQAPATARLLAQLLAGHACDIDPSPYRAHRFAEAEA